MTIFRQLFRGRDDVYPTRFVSKKTGKAGYAPACANKFVVGVCPLPKVKCGDCTNQAFRPVDDRAVREHLQGKHVMGIYPMLPDETCWFLAVDFDKSTWKEDARAFAETARRLGLPVLVERSRSGNGAHVWFFFSEPVPAAIARRMGCHVITETMSERHELSMDSYDRLFPSQDTMPRGGFGNLIALPLQHEPRRQGNSVFLDENLEPYPDDRQWSVLATTSRISLATVERVASDAARSGTVVGLRIAEPIDDEEDAAPWTRAPSGVPRVRRIVGPLPPRVSAVLAQRLFVAKEALPPPLLNQIKRLAAFQNPEFYKKQSMRLSTATTPRVIACAEDLPKHVAIPRGCRADLEELLRAHGIGLDVADERTTGTPLDVCFHGTLTPVQESAARALLAQDIGVFVAPPGVGKTVIGTYPPFDMQRAIQSRDDQAIMRFSTARGAKRLCEMLGANAPAILAVTQMGGRAGARYAGDRALGWVGDSGGGRVAVLELVSENARWLVDDLRIMEHRDYESFGEAAGRVVGGVPPRPA